MTLDNDINVCNTVSCQNPYLSGVITKIRHFDIQDLVAYLITVFVVNVWFLLCLHKYC